VPGRSGHRDGLSRETCELYTRWARGPWNPLTPRKKFAHPASGNVTAIRIIPFGHSRFDFNMRNPSTHVSLKLKVPRRKHPLFSPGTDVVTDDNAAIAGSEQKPTFCYRSSRSGLIVPAAGVLRLRRRYGAPGPTERLDSRKALSIAPAATEWRPSRRCSRDRSPTHRLGKGR
jgi:hypothetical protein